MQDLHGLPLSTRRPAAADTFNQVLRAYFGLRIELPALVKATLAADPDFALGHCVRGYFAMLTYNRANVALAAEAHSIAERLAADATERERGHVRALGSWVAGDTVAALREWDSLLEAHPTDALAVRLSQYLHFWEGESAEVRILLERIAPKWGDDLAFYSMFLSCVAFALEETGDYARAERIGRRAVELDPGDVWGTHAVTHVFEMQGRREEGITWLAGLEAHWEGKTSLVHHLWWHRALFHLEKREFDMVLELYDRRIRNLASPLVKAIPDLFVDIQNAASMLFRLERLGVDVGGRWNELAEKAEGRIGDCLSAFTLPHWVMALAATGRYAAAEAMITGMKEFAATGASRAAVVGEVALPVCEAVLAHRRGQHARAVSLMFPVLGRLKEMGASDAQRDVLEQLFLDACLKADRRAEAGVLLDRVAERYPVPAANRIGYAEAARMLS